MNRDIRENYAQLSSEFHNSIAGLKIIRAFTLEDYKKTEFNKYILEDRHLRIKTYTFNALFSSLTEYITVIGIPSGINSGLRDHQKRVTVGDIVAFYTYLVTCINRSLSDGTTTIMGRDQFDQTNLRSVYTYPIRLKSQYDCPASKPGAYCLR
jgi:ABC-type multidrug transport system fused ATPase/permease subunit